MKKNVLVVCSLAILVLGLNSCGASTSDETGIDGVIYVNVNADGDNDGTNWSNAYTELTSALENSESGNSIWVAQGTYYPTNDDDISVSFNMVDGVSVYGGFDGTEQSIDERDYINNKTILSGDIGVADDSSDNSVKVVIAANNIMDGLTITGGCMSYSSENTSILQSSEARKASVLKGEGHTDPESVSSGTAEESSNGNGIIIWQKAPTIKNCTITENTGGKGAGVYIMGAEEDGNIPTFINTTISNNIASGRGGGVSMDYYSQAYFIDCVFDSNECTAGKGGAIYNDYSGNPLIENCLFTNNYAQSGAAIANDGVSCSVVLDSTFYNNLADEAGACLYQGTGPFNDPVVKDTIMWGNICTQDKIDVYNYNECSPNITYSDIQQGYEGTGNISSDPLFTNAEAGDFTFLENSPVINAGSDSEYMGYSLSEIENRSEDDYATIMSNLDDIYANNTTVINALDITNTVTSSEAASIGSVVYVDNSLTADGDGSSWNNSINELQEAIDKANVAYNQDGEEVEIWVKEGTYVPGDERSDSFIMREGVSIYGGFSGIESALSQRDYENNITTLSGEIGSSTIKTDNCYHVLIGGDDATLDGFTVSGGYADGVDGEIYDNKGGALLNYLAGERVRPDYTPTLGFDPDILNCVFEDNYAEEGGASYTYHGGNPAFTNVEFSNNEADYGAATLDRAGTNATYTECIFENNLADYKGGAVFTDYGAMSSFYECEFIDNTATTEGGAIYTIDRASQTCANTTSFDLIDETWEDLEDIYSAVYIESCDFTGNSAGTNGGALYIYDSSYAKIVSSIFTNNSADDAAIVASYSGTVIMGSDTVFSNNYPENYTTEGTGAKIITI
jgi:predicted outer membrane repeat protein